MNVYVMEHILVEVIDTCILFFIVYWALFFSTLKLKDYLVSFIRREK